MIMLDILAASCGRFAFAECLCTTCAVDFGGPGKGALMEEKTAGRKVIAAALRGFLPNTLGKERGLA